MEKNQIYNMDCLDFMRGGWLNNSVDLLLTDCPYHIVSWWCSTWEYGNKKEWTPSWILERTRPIKKDAKGNKYYTESKHISLCWVLNDYDATTYARQGKLFKHNEIKFSEWLPLVYDMLKEWCHAYIMINWRNLKELQEEAEKVWFQYQQLLVRDKGNATPNRYYLNACEFILMLRKWPARSINNMGTKNILRVPNIIWNKKHPTEKPVELMKILIENSTNEWDLVFDPFMWAWATAIACKELNRNYIGTEIDERYYNVIQERLKEVDRINQQRLF
jgi:site-specific DNA-methyltransferase (adenine-specific)